MGRRLGQHFLYDPGILDRIVDALDPQSSDAVLEIGPGEGTLTGRLLPRVATVVALERDAALAAALATPANPNLIVRAVDALDVRWDQLMREAGVTAPFKVVGNIPYYITSPLIDRALQYSTVPLTVFLIQKEVADRLVAPAGSKVYGALTVGVQTFAHVERLLTVKSGAFRPPPRVDSAVVRLRRRTAPLVADDRRTAFREFVVALFGLRRKQLGRSLRTVLGRDAEQVTAILGSLGLAPTTRVETVTPHQLARLFEVVAR